MNKSMRLKYIINDTICNGILYKKKKAMGVNGCGSCVRHDLLLVFNLRFFCSLKVKIKTHNKLLVKMHFSEIRENDYFRE